MRISFALSWDDIENEDVTVTRIYSGHNRPYLHMTNGKGDCVLANSKKIVDAALDKSESKVLKQEAAMRSRFTMLELDNPADTIRKLFANPSLARSVVVMPDDESMEGALLEKMARLFQRNPNVPGSALMAAWYGTPEGDLLKAVLSQS